MTQVKIWGIYRTVSAVLGICTQELRQPSGAVVDYRTPQGSKAPRLISQCKKPFVYHHTVSSNIEVSLQSFFQSSVTVLICYRSLGVIFRVPRSVPCSLCCTPKQKSAGTDSCLTGLSPSMGGGHCQVGLPAPEKPLFKTSFYKANFICSLAIFCHIVFCLFVLCHI